MDEWVGELRAGRFDRAWDLFVSQYRRLLFAAIRYHLKDHDDVMDVFARACEALREEDMRRLRNYLSQPSHRARFTTWLVTVVRNLTVDWLRQQHGRWRPARILEELSPLRRRIFELVFVARHTHAEAYGLICAADPPGPRFGEFLAEVRATYHAASEEPRGRLFREVFPGQLEPDLDAVSPKEGSDARQWLEEAQQKLAALDRVAIQLYIVEELPATDIARILSLPNAKAVHNRVYRGLKSMRTTLDKAGIRREDL